VRISVTGLAPSASYTVSGAGTPSTVQSSAQGVLSFTRTLTSTATTSITVGH
jgi:hypothetical protein